MVKTNATVTVELPWPDKSLSPNARTHWRKLAQVKSAAKELAFCETRVILGDVRLNTEKEYSIEWTFCYPTQGRRDRDNLMASCKAYQDGIATAAGIDDYQFEPVILRRGPVVRGGLVIVKIAG